MTDRQNNQQTDLKLTKLPVVPEAVVLVETNHHDGVKLPLQVTRHAEESVLIQVLRR